VENLNKNTPSAKNITIPNAKTLEEKYKNKAKNVNKQAVVPDTTGRNQPIKKVVNNALNDSDLRYNGSNKEKLKKTLNQDQVVALNKLENEKNKGDGSSSRDITKEINEGKTTFNSPAGQSAAFRLSQKVAKESENVIKELVDPNNGIGGLTINKFSNNGDKKQK